MFNWLFKKKIVKCCGHPNIQSGTSKSLSSVLINRIRRAYKLDVNILKDADGIRIYFEGMRYYDYHFKDIIYAPEVCVTCYKVHSKNPIIQEVIKFEDWYKKQLRIYKEDKQEYSRKQRVDNILKEIGEF